jgi:hypothetical protein
MAKKNEGDSRNPDEDKDTQEILDEMAQDIDEPAEEKTTDKDDSDDAADDADEDDADDDADSDDDIDEDDEDAEGDTDAEDDEDSDDADKKDDSDDADDADEDQGRRPADAKDKKVMPMWQHKKALKQQEARLRKELVAAAVDASESGDDIDEDSEAVQDIVSKYKLNKDLGPGLVASILKLAEKRAGKVSDKDIQRIKQDIADRKERELFDKDMAKAVKVGTKILGSELTEKQKAKLKEMAYTKEYRHYSLTDILRLNRKAFLPKEKRQTGETKGNPPAAKSRTSKRYDLSDPNSIPWDSLSDEEFDEVSAALEKEQPKMKIIRKNGR